MTPEPPPPAPHSLPGPRGYLILCLTALMGMVLALMENERDLIWIMLLAALGGVAVYGRWRAGPPLVLIGLAVLEVFYRNSYRGHLGRGAGWQESPIMDVVLAASTLAYAAGLYRLLSLTHAVFPIDSRRPPPGPDGPSRSDGRRRRSAELPGPWEMPMLALTAGVWAVAVALFWPALSATDGPLGLPRAAWHALLLIFLVGLTAAVLAGAAAYLHWATASSEEHHLYLQDLAWRETRGEQNGIHRWLTRARLRAQRRKERS